MLLIASIVMLVNLGVDLLYGLINPRIRHARAAMASEPAAAVIEPLRRGPAIAAGASSGTISASKPGAVAGLGVIVVVRAGRRYLGRHASRPHDPTEQYREALPEAAGLAGGRLLQLPAGHRRRRPRHPLAPDLRRALLAADRRSSSSPSRSAVGIVLGLLAGFARGWTEAMIMRLMDIILALPSLLLAIVIVAILGPGLINAMFAVAVVYCRSSRA